MSIYPDIKCGLCGYKFDTYAKEIDTYDDYCPTTETRYYPKIKENAYLVRDYVCNDCYKNIGEIVRKRLITDGERFINTFEARAQKIYDDLINDYLKKKDKMAKEVDEVKGVVSTLKQKKLHMLNDEEVKMYNHLPFYSEGAYYLDRAVKIEKENKLNMKSISDWQELYKIDVKKYVLNKDTHIGTMVTKKEYLNILSNCIQTSMSAESLVSFIQKELDREGVE